MLQENDLVALLNQMPLAVAFRHVLGVSKSASTSSLAAHPSVYICVC